MAIGAKARRASFYETDQITINPEVASSLKDPQDRIEYIADLMAEGRYVTRRTCRELREVWGLSVQRINQMRESAAAVMRASLGHGDELRTKTLATIDMIRTEALQRGREDPGDMSFKWYEVALNASAAMLGFVNREVDERVDNEKRSKENAPPTETKLLVEFVTPERPKEESGQ